MGNFLGINWRNLGKSAEKLLPNITKSILPAGLDSIIEIFDKSGKKETADEIRKQFSTDEAKLEFEKLALAKLESDKNFKLRAKEIELEEKEAELKDLDSARELAKSDNLNGHKLSKIIRPVSALMFIGIFLVLFLTILICGVIIIFNPEFSDKSNDLIELAKSLFGYINVPLISVLGFFFGTRHFEKRKYLDSKDENDVQ
jgi:hypothetical protein